MRSCWKTKYKTIYRSVSSETKTGTTLHWERSFHEDCRIETTDIPATINQVKARLGKDTHFIWEDGHPVSQAVSSRNTQNGGGINGVYTPPQYRGKGYASSVVAELSKILLERGFQFCYLFADAENLISCGLYRKLGFYDLCVFDEMKFTKKADI